MFSKMNYVLKFFLFFFKWAKPGLFLVYFRSFSQHKDKYSTNFTINDKSIDGVLGSRTRGGMMEGADESTELWRHPKTQKPVYPGRFKVNQSSIYLGKS